MVQTPPYLTRVCTSFVPSGDRCRERMSVFQWAKRGWRRLAFWVGGLDYACFIFRVSQNHVYMMYVAGIPSNIKQSHTAYLYGDGQPYLFSQGVHAFSTPVSHRHTDTHVYSHTHIHTYTYFQYIWHKAYAFCSPLALQVQIYLMQSPWMQMYT